MKIRKMPSSGNNDGYIILDELSSEEFFALLDEIEKTVEFLEK